MKSERYDSSIRKELEQIDWRAILPQLLWFAQGQCKKFYWLGNEQLHPQDLVQEAIALAFGRGENGNYRNWNKEYYPDVSSFLKGVIKSIISHKIEHLKEFPHDSLELKEEKGRDSIAEATQAVKNQYDGLSGDSIETSLEKYEEEKRLSERVRKLKELAEGDEEVEIVMMCFEDGKSSPREIVKETGYDINRVNNIMKRIRRIANNIE